MAPFWKKNNKLPPSAPAPDAKECFKADLSRIESLMDRERSLTGKIALLEFAIRVIGRELETENTALFLRKGTTDPQDGSQYRIPTTTVVQKYKGVSLSQYNVVSRPWDDNRFVPAVVNVFRHGFRGDWNSSDGILYRELDLVVVSNGRHHLTAAKVKGDAAADLEVHSLRDSFSVLRTDGKYWYYKQDGIPQEEPCLDYRLAVLYELARKRWELSQDYETPEPSHRPKCVNEDNCQWYEICDLLQTKNEELQFLKTETELLRRQLKRFDPALKL